MPVAPGTRLGTYEVVSPLGKGGMGEVYLARDSRLGREVALKLLPSELSTDLERLSRFQREAFLLASLNHPNIATIYGFEEQDGQQYLVLEYVSGETLAERLQRAGPLPVDEALDLARQIADALECAHERGIIHRDLKPANICITPDGKVKVLDFGLAKDVAAGAAGAGAADISKSPTLPPAATRAGTFLGTAAYMSPEQARGKIVDRRGDIWAFACVLYELLTARQVFPGETVSDVVAVVLKQEPDWSALPADTPPHVRLLLRRCLQKDARRRLRDIGDARLELESPSTDLLPARATVSSGPHRSWPLAVALLLAGIVTGAALWALFANRTPARQFMRYTAVTNFSGIEAEPSISPDGRSVAFVSDRGGQHDIWVGLISGGTLVRITNDPNLESHPRWAPDGSRIAYARVNDSGAWDIWAVPALGGSARRLVSGGADPAWSPDGRLLLYAASDTIWVVDANGGNPKAVTKPDRFIHRQPAFSRDGRRIAFAARMAGPYAQLAVADFESGRVQIIVSDRGQVLSPAWSADDRFIYFASSRAGAINIWKIGSDGKNLEQVTAGQGDDAELDISADGKRILFSSYRENVNLAEIPVGGAANAPLKWVSSDPARNEGGPAYSPDGARLTFFTNRRGLERESVWVTNADGSNATLLVEDEACSAIMPTWTVDSQSVNYTANCGASAEVRRVAISGGVPDVLVKLRVSGPSNVSHNGRILSWNFRGQIAVAMAGAPETQVLNGIRGTWARWSPDGNRLAYVVSASRDNDPQAGIWVFDLKTEPRQVFRGWAAGAHWLSDTELAVEEAKTDLTGVIRLVNLSTGQAVRDLAHVRLLHPYWMPYIGTDFAVHPDRKRIVVSAVDLSEADIGMIEVVR